MAFNSIFFILPFFLYIGIAAQGAGFYLLCIFIPSLFFIYWKKDIPKFFITIAVCLIALHIIFPLTSIINYMIPNSKFPQFIYHISLKWPGILQSNFPSSLFIGGIATLILVKISQKKSNNIQSSLSNNSAAPLKSFLMGLLPASILICLALIYQHYSGVEFRKFGTYLGENEMLDNGRYRVFGFYGHPLTIAGVGLAYASFTWCLLWQYIANKNNAKFDFLPFINKKYLPQLTLTVITVCNVIAVFLSSGRTAVVACIFILAIIPFILCIRKKPILTSFSILVVILSSFIIAKKYGVLERIDNTAASVTQFHSLDAGNYRQYFWKVYTQMFIDSPIIGQGNYWLKAGIRDNYYDSLGYADIPEKYNAHNNYLEVLGSGGLLAAFWIVTALSILIRTLRKKLAEQKEGFLFIPFAFTTMLTANFIHALTQNVYFDSSVVYIYMGLLYVTMWQIAANEKIIKPNNT